VDGARVVAVARDVDFGRRPAELAFARIRPIVTTGGERVGTLSRIGNTVRPST
jgi:hypothetical protein